MVEGKTVALGIGALVAAEATGITNLSGGGGSRPQIIPIPAGGGGGGGDTIIPPGAFGGGSDGSLAALRGQIAGLSESVEGATGGAGASGELLSTVTDLQDRINRQGSGFQSAIENLQEQIGGIDTGLPDPGDMGPGSSSDSPGGGRGPGPGERSGLTPRQEAAKEAGRDPFGLQAMGSGNFAKFGEAFRAGGDTVTDAVSSVGQPGKDPREGTFFDFVSDAGASFGSALSGGGGSSSGSSGGNILPNVTGPNRQDSRERNNTNSRMTPLDSKAFRTGNNPLPTFGGLI